MQNKIVKVPWFINKNNQEYILDGKKIGNIEEVITLADTTGFGVFAPRDDEGFETHESNYPDDSDRVVGVVMSADSDGVEIEIYDSLYYSKLSDPVIRVNGYCTEEDNIINIHNVTRLTLTERQLKKSVL